jgi:hypothetical protein
MSKLSAMRIVAEASPSNVRGVATGDHTKIYLDDRPLTGVTSLSITLLPSKPVQVQITMILNSLCVELPGNTKSEVSLKTAIDGITNNTSEVLGNIIPLSKTDMQKVRDILATYAVMDS